MKKLIITIAAMAYMSVSTGIAMEIHYCMGKFAGIEFYGSEKEACGICGMKEKGQGCCHDEHKFIKLEDSHKNVLNTIDFSFCEPVVATEYNLYNFQFFPVTSNEFVTLHSPPDNTGPSRCIRNCVFRI